MVIVRGEKAGEDALISQILRAAFGSDAEERRLAALRGTAEFRVEMSMIAEKDGKALGYGLFYPALIGIEPAAVAAIIAVPPQFQKSGVGERLVRHGMERCRGLGRRIMVSLRLPKYFARIGFEPAASFGVKTAAAAPGDFLLLDLDGRDLKAFAGEAVFHPALTAK